MEGWGDEEGGIPSQSPFSPLFQLGYNTKKEKHDWWQYPNTPASELAFEQKKTHDLVKFIVLS